VRTYGTDIFVWAVNNLGPLGIFLICIVGLGFLGWRDVIRFSFVRTWAISSVCFTQAIRRRVLWLTPLVVLGTVVVAQLAHPIDAQDDMRQTIKLLLFATGLLVTLVIVLLAATNLPKEIETRVIYTVATKPATRLEIVLGKAIGFARVSGTVLLLMGVLGLGYLYLKEWHLVRQVDADLATPGAVGSLSRQTQEYYRSAGLLHARRYAVPRGADDADFSGGLQIVSGSGGQWSLGGGEQDIVVPFRNFAADVPPQIRQRLGPAGFLVRMALATRTAGGLPKPQIPIEGPGVPPVPLPQDPRVQINILDANRELAMPGVEVLRRAVKTEGGYRPSEQPAREGLALRGTADLVAWIDAKALARMDEAGDVIYLQVHPAVANYEYAIQDVEITYMNASGALASAQRLGGPVYRGRPSPRGQQLRGDRGGRGPVATFRFNEGQVESSDSKVPFELRVTIERSGGDQESEGDDPTRLELAFHPDGAGSPRHRLVLTPESNRSVLFEVPASAVGSGRFTVDLRNLTTGHWISLRAGENASLRLVASAQSFALNLFKSLLVMWLMAILVAVIAVFCSTFVSWPIAVVLSLVILLGHWLVTEIGSQKGMERQIVQDIFGRNLRPAEAHAGTQIVKGLNEFVTTVATVLPDISQFASIEKIEAGAAMPGSVIAGSLKVTFGFGLPLVVLTYIILRFKEVAP
jgi:ABC-type transport system involved in multi-copper enzyme maturation permease subunit